MRRNLTSAALIGAQLESAVSPVKSYSTKDITSRVKTLVKGAVDKILTAPIWGKINETTGNIVAKIFGAGRDAGQSAAEIAATVKETLAGEAGKTRAADIARTETTLGLTTGQDAQRQEWVESGYTGLKKMWNTMGDEKVRETHSPLEGVKVPIDGQFDVGGELAYGPADPGLSAAERCGCRCWTTTV